MSKVGRAARAREAARLKKPPPGARRRGKPSSRRARENHKAKALEAARSGNRAAAQQLFGKAICVTHAMVRKLIGALRERGVDYVVAPYEVTARAVARAVARVPFSLLGTFPLRLRSSRRARRTRSSRRSRARAPSTSS